jgi:Lar family restriction alleviation protein
MKTPDLKPCPFCGGKADVFCVEHRRFRAICRKCGAQTHAYVIKENAAAMWDRRANDAEKRPDS